MDDQPDDIDEVALNVLLAEGVDLPTALEASRRDSTSGGKQAGCLGTAMIAVVLGTVVGLATFNYSWFAYIE